MLAFADLRQPSEPSKRWSRLMPARTSGFNYPLAQPLEGSLWNPQRETRRSGAGVRYGKLRPFFVVASSSKAPAREAFRALDSRVTSVR